MAVALIALSALTAATAAPHPAPLSPKINPACQESALSHTASPRGARPHPLTDEPQATALFAVLKRENGCSKPVPVRDYQRGRAEPVGGR
ncbi:MAG: hypothetical protein RQ833_04130 [Sphingomonadaceae bacterium]|nr:hypothetical protein [Sphingomonadaceae bacterium]